MSVRARLTSAASDVRPSRRSTGELTHFAPSQLQAVLRTVLPAQVAQVEAGVGPSWPSNSEHRPELHLLASASWKAPTPACDLVTHEPEGEVLKSHTHALPAQVEQLV